MGQLREIHEKYPIDEGHQIVAESGMMEGEFDEGHHDAIRNAIARMGVADVRAFGLTWEDCQEILRPLGYSSRVEIAAIQD